MAVKNPDIWVGAEDYSDPAELKRVYKDHFHSARQAVLSSVGYLTDCDMDERRVNRRRDTHCVRYPMRVK